MFITQESIKEIAQYRGEAAVTLYIYTSPEESPSSFKTRAEIIIKNIEEKIRNQSEKQFHVLSQQLYDLKEKINVDAIYNKGRTMCIFIAPGFEKIIQLPMELQERSIVDDTFYIVPLFTVIEHFERYAVLLFDKNNVRLFNYYLGSIEEVDDIYGSYMVPASHRGSSSWRSLKDKRMDHRIGNDFHRHLKEISNILFINSSMYEFDKLIIASHKEELAAIKQHLHSYLTKILIGEFVADVKSSIKEIEEKAKNVIAEYKVNFEKEKLEMLSSQLTKKSVMGAEDVVKALMIGNVRELVINSNFTASGYICPEEHFISTKNTDSRKCPFCDTILKEKSHIDNYITEQALLQGAEISYILYQQPEVFKEQIGAFLRFKPQ